MKYPKLTQPAREQTVIDRFLGYEHRPDVRPGAFYDMKNLSGAKEPLLTVRPRRTVAGEPDGTAMTGVAALLGGEPMTVLYRDGGLRCGTRTLYRLLEGEHTVTAFTDAENSEVTLEEAAALTACPRDGGYVFVYDAATGSWLPAGRGNPLPASAVTLSQGQAREGDQLFLSVQTRLPGTKPRQLVRMGAWVAIFPDGYYVNSARLAAGGFMLRGRDYGTIGRTNACHSGQAVFTPCTADGTAITPVSAGQAPQEGYWIDTSEPEPVLKKYSRSQGAWIEAAGYVKCAVPGIAKELQAGDGVERVLRTAEDTDTKRLLSRLWNGSGVLTDASHDPGGTGRAEGTDDFVILPGLLAQACTLELDPEGNEFISLTRPLPEMEFIVECRNRLWGCRSGDTHELLASKLGDLRNWACFEGLSTDSYRVSRGDPSPFTGAAVLDGCPLFFREASVEKIYPSAVGAHGVVTHALSGVAAGCAASLQVIRGRLYYKSPDGVCCYTGALPGQISRPLGDRRCRTAAAGALGERYYLSMTDETGAPELFVFDTRTGQWHREDETAFVSAAAVGDRLFCLKSDGTVFCVDPDQTADGVLWYAETGELQPALQTRRRVSRLQLRITVEPGGEARVYVSYDGGPWQRKASLLGRRRLTRLVPVFPHRCESLRLRLEGTGGMALERLSYLTERGSEL